MRDAQELGIAHLVVVPCLFLTFLFGPAGWLVYLTLRGAPRTIIGQPISVRPLPFTNTDREVGIGFEGVVAGSRLARGHTRASRSTHR
jgi:hypothetical protein